MPATCRRTALAVLSLAALTLALGCRSAVEVGPATQLTLTPQEAVAPTGPPTVARLLLRLHDGNVELVAAEARRGTLLETDLEAARTQALEGEVQVMRYHTLAAGQQLASGYFVVPIVGVAEFLDPDERHRIRRQIEHRTDPVVRVTIPYAAALDRVVLEPLTPSEDAPIEQWPIDREQRVAFDLDLGDPQQPYPPQGEEDDRVEP